MNKTPRFARPHKSRCAVGVEEEGVVAEAEGEGAEPVAADHQAEVVAGVDVVGTSIPVTEIRMKKTPLKLKSWMLTKM